LDYDSANGVFSVTTYKSTDFDSDFSGKTTNDLAEGNVNLYFTDARAVDAVEASDLTINGNVTATAFIGDGSQLTGITATGSGIENTDDNLIFDDQTGNLSLASDLVGIDSIQSPGNLLLNINGINNDLGTQSASIIASGNPFPTQIAPTEQVFAEIDQDDQKGNFRITVTATSSGTWLLDDSLGQAIVFDGIAQQEVNPQDWPEYIGPGTILSNPLTLNFTIHPLRSQLQSDYRFYWYVESVDYQTGEITANLSPDDFTEISQGDSLFVGCLAGLVSTENEFFLQANSFMNSWAARHSTNSDLTQWARQDLNTINFDLVSPQINSFEFVRGFRSSGYRPNQLRVDADITSAGGLRINGSGHPGFIDIALNAGPYDVDPQTGLRIIPPTPANKRLGSLSWSVTGGVASPNVVLPAGIHVVTGDEETNTAVFPTSMILQNVVQDRSNNPSVFLESDFTGKTTLAGVDQVRLSRTTNATLAGYFNNSIRLSDQVSWLTAQSGPDQISTQIDVGNASDSVFTIQTGGPGFPGGDLEMVLDRVNNVGTDLNLELSNVFPSGSGTIVEGELVIFNSSTLRPFDVPVSFSEVGDIKPCRFEGFSGFLSYLDDRTLFVRFFGRNDAGTPFYEVFEDAAATIPVTGPGQAIESGAIGQVLYDVASTQTDKQWKFVLEQASDDLVLQVDGQEHTRWISTQTFNSQVEAIIANQLATPAFRTLIEGIIADFLDLPPPDPDPEPLPQELDGGDSSTTEFDQTLDGGDSSTTEFDQEADGGDSSEPLPQELDGGDSSTTEFDQTLDGGDSSTTEFDQEADGGDSSDELSEELDGGSSATSEFTTTLDGGDSSTTEFGDQVDGGDSSAIETGENDGGNSSTTEFNQEANGGDSATTTYDDEIDGGES
jgi:hypothetical protein